MRARTAFGLALAAALLVAGPGAALGGVAARAAVPAEGAPVVLLGGAVEADADATAVVLAGAAELRVRGDLALLDTLGALKPAREVVVRGEAVVLRAEGAPLSAAWASPGALGMLLPDGLPEAEGAGLALAGASPSFAASGSGRAILAVLGGRVEADGAAVDVAGVALSGGWRATGGGDLAVLAFAPGEGLRARVAPGDAFPFAALRDRLQSLSAHAEDAAGAPVAAQAPVDVTAPGAPGLAGLVRAEDAMALVGDLLNGAVLVVPGEAPLALEAGGEERPAPKFALLRGHVAFAAADGEYAAQGDDVVAFDGRAFAAPPAPLVAFGVPLLAALLWVAALATVAWRLARRPPEEPARPWTYRLGAVAAHAAAFAVAFLLWDVAFRQVAGTSAVEAALAGRGWIVVGSLLAIQMLPWSLAALAFGLPARIVASNVLARRGHGKRARGFAKAAGVAATGVAVHVYAVWMVNAWVLPYLPA